MSAIADFLSAFASHPKQFTPELSLDMIQELSLDMIYNVINTILYIVEFFGGVSTCLGVKFEDTWERVGRGEGYL